MQSRSARRRVESGRRGDEDFGISLAVADWRDAVRGDHGRVRAKHKHEHAEEAGDNLGEELGCEDFEQEFVDEEQSG